MLWLYSLILNNHGDPSRHEPERSETVLREGARADSPAVGALPRRVLGRDREEASSLAPNDRTLVERSDDLRRFGVDQARGVELLVRAVLVAPADGEPLAEPGASDLPAQLGPEGAAGLAGPCSHRVFDVAQLGPNVTLKRTPERCYELGPADITLVQCHAKAPVAQREGTMSLFREVEIWKDWRPPKPLLLVEENTRDSESGKGRIQALGAIYDRIQKNVSVYLVIWLFCILTISSSSDVLLLLSDSKIELPIVGYKLDFFSFIIFSPFILEALLCNIYLALEQLDKNRTEVEFDHNIFADGNSVTTLFSIFVLYISSHFF
jgi:hypothetical protein